MQDVFRYAIINNMHLPAMAVESSKAVELFYLKIKYELTHKKIILNY